MATTSNHIIAKQETRVSVNKFTYYLYLLFVISFFLHLSARIPSIKVLRPDMMLTVIIFFMLFIQQNKLKGLFNNLCNRSLAIFLAYIILSLPFVEWPGSVLRGNLEEFIKAIVFFYFTILIIDTDTRLKQFIFVFMCCQLFRVLEPLYMHITDGYWGSSTYIGVGQYTGRLGGAPSDIINSNGLAFVVVTLFPFLHYLWGGSRWVAKISYLSLVPALIYALILTMSRSGFIAMLIIGWSIFRKSQHKFILIIISILIAVLAWANMSDIQRERYLSLTGTQEVRGASTVQGRIDGMKQEWGVALERPLVGHGIRTSREAKYNVVRGTRVSHNLYLEIMIETGIIGFIIFMFFLKSIYNTMKQTAKYLPDKSNKNGGNRDKKNSTVELNDMAYYKKLLMTLNAVFWMYIIFSLAQYGLSEYHWYLLAGLATVLNRISKKNTYYNQDGTR